MTRLISLFCIATLGAALPALADTQWTRTGPNGGTATGARSCTAEAGAYACSGERTATGAQGRTATQTWQGHGTADGGARTATTIRPNGETRTRTFTWQRDN
jgi:hypothetical protein